MSRLRSLKDLIYQRLTAAVDEIIGHLEQTITEYEEATECRQRELLDTGSKPEDKMQSAEFSADILQPLRIKEEPQERSPGLAQEHPEHTDVKEENDDILEFPFARVPVKSDDDEEKPQSSQLLQRQTEGTNGEAEPPASSSSVRMETDADGRDHAGSEPDRGGVALKRRSQSNDETSHFSVAVARSGDDWTEVKKPQTDLITLKNKVPVNDAECRTGKSFSCSKCGKRFGQKHHLQMHMRLHTGEKPFSCPLCDKRFTQKGNLKQHMTVHTREKPCSCPVCGERFAQQGHLTQHMTVHTREKLCCSQISKGH